MDPRARRALRTTCLLAPVAGAVVALPAAAVAVAARGRVLGRDEVLAAPPASLPRTAVVLGAHVYPEGRPSRFLRARLEVAADLHRAGLVDVIVVSGASGAEHNDEPDAMRDWLLAAGIPADAVLVDERGFDTYDTCKRARDHFGLRRIVLVSQDFHLPRAVAIARVLGLDAVGVGDESLRGTRTWRAGAVRERAANLKMLRDLASRRDPATA